MSELYPYPKPTHDWPRLRDLPQPDRERFEAWLGVNSRSRPWLDTQPADQQDGYYHYDLRDWVRHYR